MRFDSLGQFLDHLDKAGQLRRIGARVDPELEITEIADRVMAELDGGPALLFENVKGSPFPLAINVFGSAQRTAWALGAQEWGELEHRIAALLDLVMGGPPQGIRAKLSALGDLSRVARIQPRQVSSGPCQEVIETENPSLAQLPIQKCWPEDGGRYITMPLVFTHDPTTGKRNVGMYRLQVFDDRTLGLHWQLHKGGQEHFARSQGSERLEVAVAVGAEPAMIYAATAPLPPGIDETVFAGFLRQRPVEMVKAVSVDIRVPASAEFVIEGWVDPAETRIEGPFGDHTGVYSLEDPYPVLHVTAVTRRRDPVYISTIVGRPPKEDRFLGGATERLFLPLVRLMIPELVDMHLPYDSVFHNFAIVSIKKRYPGHARKVMHAIWGLGQLMFSKFVIVVDENVNVQNLREVLWRVGNNVDPAYDIELSAGPTDTLDHAAREPNFAGKIGIDATIKLESEGFRRRWPPDIVMDPQIKTLVDRRWEEYGL